MEPSRLNMASRTTDPREDTEIGMAREEEKRDGQAEQERSCGSGGWEESQRPRKGMGIKRVSYIRIRRWGKGSAASGVETFRVEAGWRREVLRGTTGVGWDLSQVPLGPGMILFLLGNSVFGVLSASCVGESNKLRALQLIFTRCSRVWIPRCHQKPQTRLKLSFLLFAAESREQACACFHQRQLSSCTSTLQNPERCMWNSDWWPTLYLAACFHQYNLLSCH